jgi:hypothetical protein
MAPHPDRLRNACALAALYFGAAGIYASDPASGALQLAPLLALVGLWLSLASALDILAERLERVAV